MSEVRTLAGGPPVASPTLVQADQRTILGDGSHERPLHAGESGGVVTDGVTILGNGTAGDPLHAGVVDGTFRASFRGGSVAAAPGIPVFASFVSQPGGITTVQPTDVSPAAPSTTDFSAFASVFGVVASVNLDGTVQVSSGGLLTLTAAQWDDLTGGSGGLTRGKTYFAARSASSLDFLATAPDPTPGSFTTRVGVALSAETMLVAPSVPVQNLGDLIVFARFAASPLILGSAVIVSSNDHVSAATSDVSVSGAQAIGIIAALDVNAQPIVQVAGVVTLTTAEWDAVTDTVPGMSAGTGYFVDTNANPGHLTSIAPVAGSKVQVGVGLSTTQLVLSAPFSQRLS